VRVLALRPSRYGDAEARELLRGVGE